MPGEESPDEQRPTIPEESPDENPTSETPPESKEEEPQALEEPTPKPRKRGEGKKILCEKCGRSYSARRIEDHKCVPPTFTVAQTPEPPPPRESPPLPDIPETPESTASPKRELRSSPREPTLDDITPEVISMLIKKEREMKRAAKRERWTQLFT